MLNTFHLENFGNISGSQFDRRKKKKSSGEGTAIEFATVFFFFRSVSS